MKRQKRTLTRKQVKRANEAYFNKFSKTEEKFKPKKYIKKMIKIEKEK